MASVASRTPFAEINDGPAAGRAAAKKRRARDTAPTASGTAPTARATELAALKKLLSGVLALSGTFVGCLVCDAVVQVCRHRQLRSCDT